MQLLLANGMLPKIDFPELLLEVAELTGMTTAFTHISGADPHMDDFEVSVCALLLAEACNVGLTPVAAERARPDPRPPGPGRPGLPAGRNHLRRQRDAHRCAGQGRHRPRLGRRAGRLRRRRAFHRAGADPARRLQPPAT